MPIAKKVIAAALAAVLAALPVLLVLLWAEPPELLRVGAGYTAKTVCSNVFLANRDPTEVLETDVQAPGHPLLRLMRIDVDRPHGAVRAGLFGFIGAAVAVARAGSGCTLLVDGHLDALQAAVAPGAAGATSPPLESVAEGMPSTTAVRAVLGDDALAGPGARAIVVLIDGRLVAERYWPGFGAAVPQLGWSMAKSVTAGLIGLLVRDQRLRLDEPAGYPPGDERQRITIADLLSMTSGLQFNEGYGSVSDVTRMLYLAPDMAAFARDKPLVHPVGAVWSYSSGSAVILSRIIRERTPGDAAAFVRTRLFEPLGMKSAVIEADEAGTLVGSSYMYATPRDWARYAQFLLQDGVWDGHELLPRGFVAMMAAPVGAAGGKYGRGMVWRAVSDGPQGLPADAFWMTGHDGQYAAIVPSRRVVVVRMGLTPARQRYRPEPLVRAVLAAVR